MIITKETIDYSRSKWGKELVYNKEMNIHNTVSNLLTQTRYMFTYENLPETIPVRILEEMLQELGRVVFHRHKGEYYVYDANAYGIPNVYHEYDTWLVNNVAQNMNKQLKEGRDMVLIRNDSNMLGLIPLMLKYANFKAESDITIHMNLILSRLMNVITVNDSDDAVAVNQIYEDLKKGDLNAIQLDNLLSEVNTYQLGQQNIDFTKIIEMEKFLKGEIFNTLGMPLNDNMKRSYISDKETDMQAQASMYFVLNMLMERRVALEKINKLYNLDIQVELNSEWFGFIDEMLEYQEEISPEEENGTDSSGDDPDVNTSDNGQDTEEEVDE